MGKRLVTIFELLIFATLFSLFSSLVITTNTNDLIIENTEEFVELVRYKGCITKDMYYDFLDSFSSPVEVKFQITRYPVLAFEGSGSTLNFTKDVVSAFENDSDGDGTEDNIYKMNVGDEITVSVRKPSGNYYDAIVSRLAGNTVSHDNPVIALKGGRILNTQYE